MTHVTPSTARALKAAGFPQPTQKPSAGQVWYNASNSTPYYITASEGERCDYMAGGTLFIDRYLLNEVFAPTAEDILRKISTWYYLCWLPESSEWACIEADSYGRTLRQYRNANSAEACAAAYLDKYAQK